MHLGQGMAAAPHPPANGYGGGAWPAWQMPGAPPWQPGSNPTADMTADAEAEAAKEAAETAKHEFFQMLVEHRITAFSRWESSKKFEGDARYSFVLHAALRGFQRGCDPCSSTSGVLFGWCT